MARSRQYGFSLTELVIVVAVILVVAAIAVPRLLHARMRANQASATASLKAIQSAEAIYTSSYPAVGYSASLMNLGRNGSTCETVSSTNACLIDDALSTGIKSGYIFDLTGDSFTPDQSYTVTAVPESVGSSGECSFSSDQSGGIHAQANTGHTSFLQMGSGGGGGCDFGK
jgi:type IV pilus assembly protein PilA